MDDKDKCDVAKEPECVCCNCGKEFEVPAVAICPKCGSRQIRRIVCPTCGK